MSNTYFVNQPVQFRKRNSKFLYKVTAFFGAIIRVVILPIFIPNIFEVITTHIISSLHMPLWLYQILLALAMAGLEKLCLKKVFHKLAFATVGVNYAPNSCRAYGSFWYTIFYTLFTGLPIFLFWRFSIGGILCIFFTFELFNSLMRFISISAKLTPPDFKIKLIIQSVITVSLLIISILIETLCF